METGEGRPARLGRRHIKLDWSSIRSYGAPCGASSKSLFGLRDQSSVSRADHPTAKEQLEHSVGTSGPWISIVSAPSKETWWTRIPPRDSNLCHSGNNPGPGGTADNIPFGSSCSMNPRSPHSLCFVTVRGANVILEAPFRRPAALTMRRATTASVGK